MKTFYRDKSFCDNLLSIWSIAINVVYVLSIIVAAVFFDSEKVHATDPNSKFQLTLLFWATLLGAFLIIVLTLVKAKVEREFWETVKEVEEMFELNWGVDFHCGKFNRVCGCKFVTMLLSVLVSEVLMAIFLKANQTSLVKFAILRNLFKVITRFIVIKYIFYVDVLRVCLKNIEMKLTRTKIFRKGDLRILKKVYALCWRLSYMIEDIFGWGIAYAILLLVGAATFNGYDICCNYAKGNVIFSPFVPLFIKIIGVWALTSSCKKCVDSTVKIASLAFSINSKLFHKIVEEFALQIMHQRIKFEPKGFFRVDHKLVVSVSKMRFVT